MKALRVERAVWTFLLYLLLVIAILGPIAAPDLVYSGLQDLANHLSGIIEARNALAEGQFPVRVAPHQYGGLRYPIFQFYGYLPYMMGALLHLVVDPYQAFKGVIALAIITGGAYTSRSVRALTGRTAAGVIAGALFILSPYISTDIHGRFAYPELVSFCLIPAVFYYTKACLAGPGLRRVAACALAWCALALSHSISLLYGALLMGPFFLWWGLGRRQARRVIGRLSCAALLAIGLSSWYIFPQFYMSDKLTGGLLVSIFDTAGWLTRLGVLFSPTVMPPLPQPVPNIDKPAHFGLQIGWPILCGTLLAAALWRNPRGLRAARLAPLKGLVSLFAVAFVIVWTPFDFWQYMPHVLQFVQYPYRLLMFCVTFGCLLTGLALAVYPRKPLGVEHIGLATLIAGVFISSYLTPHRVDAGLSIAKELANPNMGRGGACDVYRPGSYFLLQSTLAHTDFNWGDAPHGVYDNHRWVEKGEIVARIAPTREGDHLRVEGEVTADLQGPLHLTVRVDGALIEDRYLRSGFFKFRPLLPPSAHPATVVVHAPPRSVPAPPGPMREPHNQPLYKLSHLRIEREGGADEPQLLGANTLAGMTRYGHPSVTNLNVMRRSLAVIPVLAYPGMQRVEVDGQVVPYTHMERWVATYLEPGFHRVSVTFTGLMWANWLSGVCWCVVALLLVLGKR